MRVYLAGPITGHSPGDIANWRETVRAECKDVDFVDPALAAYDAGNSYSKPETGAEALRRLNHGRFVLDRNKLLIKNCDLIFANVLGGNDRVSIGTVGELFLAYSYGKSVIVVREQSENIHDHAMLNAIASTVCFSLEEGCEVLRSFDHLRRRTA